jgi:hypothetical protein
MNWPSASELLAHFVLMGVPVLLTIGCGAALIVQSHELREQVFASVEKCRGEEAAAEARGGGASARDAYAGCMDSYTITRPEGVTHPTVR